VPLACCLAPGQRITQVVLTVASVSEYAFYAFFRFQKRDFLRFFEIMCQKVAENPEKKFRPRSMEMSSHTSLSDHCNSVPSSPTMIHSEPDFEEQ